MADFAVLISKSAEKDLEAIYSYISAADSVEQADKIEERLIESILSLETLPSRGKIPQEMLNFGVTDYREIQLMPWRIFYYVTEKLVNVVAVLDGRRNIGDLLHLRLLQ